MTLSNWISIASISFLSAGTLIRRQNQNQIMTSDYEVNPALQEIYIYDVDL